MGRRRIRAAALSGDRGRPQPGPWRPGGLRRMNGERPMGATAQDILVQELQRICGVDGVLTHPHALRSYESDDLLQYRVVPRVAVLPDDAEEVRRVVAACHRGRVPWVARGSGTGLSGGALPVEDGV